MTRRSPDPWSSDGGHGWLPERSDDLVEHGWAPDAEPVAAAVPIAPGLPIAPVEEPEESEHESLDPARRGLHIGPLRITATRIMLVLALVGSVGYVAYALTVRESSQIPMLASGAGVLGLVFITLAASGAIGSYRAGRDGDGGRAVLLAFGGGIAMLLAAGCLAGAVILALVYRAA